MKLNSSGCHVTRPRFFSSSHFPTPVAPRLSPPLIGCPKATSCSPRSPTEIYHDLCQQGRIVGDERQKAILQRMDRLWESMPQYQHDMATFNSLNFAYKAEWERQRHRLQLEKTQKWEQERETWQYQLSSKLHRHMAQSGWPRLVTRGQRFLYNEKAKTRLLDREVAAAMPLPKPVMPTPPKGFYIYGSVGTGKSLLMDVLYAATRERIALRRRVHFNTFLMEVQQRLHAMDTQVLPKDDKARKLRQLATGLFGPDLARSGGALICFDELQVNDPFYAVVIREVFEELFSLGCIIVATSNRSLVSLNRDHTTKDSFKPLQRCFESLCHVEELAGAVDYRRMDLPHCADNQPATSDPTSFFPSSSSVSPSASPSSSTFSLPPSLQDVLSKLGASAFLDSSYPDRQQTMRNILQMLCTRSKPKHTVIPVPFGRSLELQAASLLDRVAMLTFQDICDGNFGLPDYHALAMHFNVLLLADVPQLSTGVGDLTRRLILLIDEVYCNQIKLVCSAAVPIDQLFAGTAEQDKILALEFTSFETEAEGTRSRRDVTQRMPIGATQARNTALQTEDERFSFHRAVSRLHEMSRPAWINR
eukprot:g50759.t1